MRRKRNTIKYVRFMVHEKPGKYGYGFIGSSVLAIGTSNLLEISRRGDRNKGDKREDVEHDDQ
jgi:hypothetical protein